MTDAIATDAIATDNPYRLPRSVVPHRYTLALQPDLAAASFVGHVIIDATINGKQSEVDRLLTEGAFVGPCEAAPCVVVMDL